MDLRDECSPSPSVNSQEPSAQAKGAHDRHSPGSVIAWRGPSVLTGDPIELIITGLGGTSQNAKTGPMAQAWIVRQDGNPSRDLGTERERAVCGDCPLRGARGTRVCYVEIGIWLLARHRHRYPMSDVETARRLLARDSIRLGAYGDPAAVPFAVWAALLKGVTAWTGYTHQWRTCDPRFKTIVMASVETELDRREAGRIGWRTFRVVPTPGDVERGEIRCRNEVAGTTCAACTLCNGGARSPRSIAVTVHGPRAHSFRSAALR